MYQRRRYQLTTVRPAIGFALDDLQYPDLVQARLLDGTRKDEGKDACWRWGLLCPALWVSLVPRGYTQIGVARLSWVFAHGRLDEGRQVRRDCETPTCLRPSHLYVPEGDKSYWRTERPARIAQGREIIQARMPASLRHLDIETIVGVRYALWAEETTVATARRYRIPINVVETIKRLPSTLFSASDSMAPAPSPEPDTSVEETGTEPAGMIMQYG